MHRRFIEYLLTERLYAEDVEAGHVQQFRKVLDSPARDGDAGLTRCPASAWPPCRADDAGVLPEPEDSAGDTRTAGACSATGKSSCACFGDPLLLGVISGTLLRDDDGPCKRFPYSTIMDCTKNEQRILKHGTQ